MEPVPETERMEAFRSSPLPTLRLPSALPPPTRRASSPDQDAAAADVTPTPRKPPPSLRRGPDPAMAWSPTWTPSWSSSPSPLPAAALSFRPRTTSPLSGFHTRSRSSGGGLPLPGMTRTQSMPGVNGQGHLQFGTDPRASMTAFGTLGHQKQQRPPPLLTRTPRKALVEDVFPLSPTRVSVLHDDADHPQHERSSAHNLDRRSVSPSTAGTPTLASLPLARIRRPSSPYRRISSGTPPPLPPLPAPQAPQAPQAQLASSLSSSSSSSSNNNNNPGLLSSSSIPSTPTSTRSRSPSISSLETIPDSPDAEEAALQAEHLAQLQAAAAAASEGAAAAAAAAAADGKGGRSSLDAPPRGRTLAFGSRDKRKRWSVCGAERRGDLDLETIWED